jgi:hypothetical protein
VRAATEEVTRSKASAEKGYRYSIYPELCQLSVTNTSGSVHANLSEKLKSFTKAVIF